MTLICPDCKAHTLHINHALELPPDGYHDEIRLQLVGCVHCGLIVQGVFAIKQSETQAAGPPDGG